MIAKLVAFRSVQHIRLPAGSAPFVSERPFARACAHPAGGCCRLARRALHTTHFATDCALAVSNMQIEPRARYMHRPALFPNWPKPPRPPHCRLRQTATALPTTAPRRPLQPAAISRFRFSHSRAPGPCVTQSSHLPPRRPRRWSQLRIAANHRWLVTTGQRWLRKRKLTSTLWESHKTGCRSRICFTSRTAHRQEAAARQHSGDPPSAFSLIV